MLYQSLLILITVLFVNKLVFSMLHVDDGYDSTIELKHVIILVFNFEIFLNMHGTVVVTFFK